MRVCFYLINFNTIFNTLHLKLILVNISSNTVCVCVQDTFFNFFFFQLLFGASAAGARVDGIDNDDDNLPCV